MGKWDGENMNGVFWLWESVCGGCFGRFWWVVARREDLELLVWVKVECYGAT